MKLKRMVTGALVMGVALCCGGQTTVDNGGKTNWLERCNSDVECGEGSCESGACAVACEHKDDCSGLDDANCGPEIVRPDPGEDNCGAPPRNFCLPECEEDDDCADIGSDYACRDGLCTPTATCGQSCEAMDARSSGDDCLELEGYAWDGADCVEIVCGCDGSDCDGLFRDRPSCLDEYSPCQTSGAYPFCSDDSDCAAGEACFAGTCAASCTDSAQCGFDEGCLFEETETCLLAVVDPSSDMPSGQCLARCRTDADCEAFAPGLSCWTQGCVRSLPECETRCPKIADTCPDGCNPITGRPYYPDQLCRGAQYETLGCVLEGRPSTSDDQCVKSPEGAVYAGISGTHARQLVQYGGYTSCSFDDVDAASGAVPCDRPPSPRPYPTLSDGTLCDPWLEIASSCGIEGCHDAISSPLSGNLDLQTPGIIDRVLDVPSDICPDQLLINSYRFEQSLLYTKLGKNQPEACGLAMPYSAGYPSSFDANRECLQAWVENVVNGFE